MKTQGDVTSPHGRSTAFEAVQGEPEHYNGAVLLVSAYAVLWAILLAWVALSWKRQSALHARLAELERVIADADAHHPSFGGAPRKDPPG